MAGGGCGACGGQGVVQIRFYCLENHRNGASLMARAAMGCHVAALYSLAVIQFNGSSGSKGDKDLRVGAALRELGHYLQDGYGVSRRVAEGCRLFVHSNACELAAALSLPPSFLGSGPHHHHAATRGGGCYSLLSDFGCHAAAGEGHPTNRFLVEWFGVPARGAAVGGGEGSLRMCSH